MIQLDETIAALASAPGPAARGIVRISGPDVVAVLQEVFAPLAHSPFRPQRIAGVLTLRDWPTPLPTDLLLWPTRRSYTGQPLAELHTVGSPPLLDAVLAEVFSRGVRPALPGEFTLRAFLAGRIDLSQAEAVLGVIDARTDSELKTALDQMAGGLSSRMLSLRSDLLDLLSDLEAGLDFADEAIEFVSQPALIGRLGLARDAVGELLEHAARRMRPAVRQRVVLAGLPNAGKSTLFNALAAGPRALVSPVAGTTRDYLSAEVELGGVPVVLIDTAGQAEHVAGIEERAQDLAREQVDQADLIVWCQAADVAVARSERSFDNHVVPILSIRTKGDLPSAGSKAADLVVSVKTGQGLDALVHAIAACLTCDDRAECRLLGNTAARSHESLRQAHEALDRAIRIARHESDQELLAIEVRDALGELGKIVGAVYTDDILDQIFSKFCIGK